MTNADPTASSGPSTVGGASREQRVMLAGEDLTGPRRVALLAAISLALVALVAALSPGLPARVRGGAGGISARSLLGDASAVVLVAALVLLLLAVSQTEWLRPLYERRKRRRSPLRVRSLDAKAVLVPLLLLALTSLVLALSALVGGRQDHLGGPATPAAPGVSAIPHGSALRPRHAAQVPVNDIMLVVLAGLVMLVALALGVRAWRRARESRSDQLAADAVLATAVDESLEDLARESDPRRAVIKAYARMEGALARCGVGRGRAETPLEYLRRALAAVHASQRSIERLTDLFEQARFSSHSIDAAMKQEAFGALAALRAELADAPGAAP